MSVVKLKDLQKTARALNEALRLKPKIDIDQDEDDLKGDILEAAELITESDDIPESVQETIDILKAPKKKEEKKKATPPPEDEGEPPDEDEPSEDEEEPSEDEDEPSEDEEEPSGDEEEGIVVEIVSEVKNIVEKAFAKAKGKEWMLERITEYFEDLDLEEEPCEEKEEKPKKKEESKKKGGFARK